MGRSRLERLVLVDQLVRMAGLGVMGIVFLHLAQSMQSSSPGDKYVFEPPCGELTGSYIADSSDLLRNSCVATSCTNPRGTVSWSRKFELSSQL